jgi:hypothetical protein
VHAFGKSNDAGPGQGWDTTTLYDKDTTIAVKQLLYGRKLQIQPAPASLTYLAHAFGGDGDAARTGVVLTHYISTSGKSGFDQIVKVSLAYSSGANKGKAVQLRREVRSATNISRRNFVFVFVACFVVVDVCSAT